MTITTPQIRTALKTAMLTVTGVHSAYDKIPRTLLGVELPSAIVVAGAETYDDNLTYGTELLQQTTAVQIQVYVAEAGTGTEYVPETDAETLFNACKRYFWARKRLFVSAYAFDVRLTNATGVIELGYPRVGDGKSYAGFVLTLSCLHHENIAIVSG